MKASLGNSVGGDVSPQSLEGEKRGGEYRFHLKEELGPGRRSQ